MDNFLTDLSVYSVLLPLLSGLILWKFQDANAKIMVVLMAFASVSQIIGSQSKDHKSLIYNLYILIDVFFWSLLLYRNASARFIRALIVLLCMAIQLFSLYTFYQNGLNKNFYSYLICFDNLNQVICVLIYFYERYYNEKIIRLADDSMFWFCMGILFYAPCTYFIFVYRSTEGKVPSELGYYHDILNTLLYILITTGFLIRIKRVSAILKWT
jgi:hypothetical protein